MQKDRIDFDSVEIIEINEDLQHKSFLDSKSNQATKSKRVIKYIYSFFFILGFCGLVICLYVKFQIDSQNSFEFENGHHFYQYLSYWCSRMEFFKNISILSLLCGGFLGGTLDSSIHIHLRRYLLIFAGICIIALFSDGMF